MANKKKTAGATNPVTQPTEQDRTAQENADPTEQDRTAQENADLTEQDSPEAPKDATQPQNEKDDPPEAFTPYKATVDVPLIVIRRGKNPHPEDKPIGTMARGDRVTVIASKNGFAMLDNGTYLKESYLKR